MDGNSFGGKVVSLCKLLGNTCNYSVNTRALPEAISHFQNHHKYAICTRPCFDIVIPEIKHVYSSKFTPVIVQLDATNRQLFVIRCTISGINSTTLSVSCLEISELDLANNSVQEYKIECSIFPIDISKEPEIIWSTAPYKIQHFPVGLFHPVFQLPYSFLMSRYSVNNTLTVKCSLIKKNEQLAHRLNVEKVLIRMEDSVSEPAKDHLGNNWLSVSPWENMPDLQCTEEEQEKTCTGWFGSWFS